MIYAKNATNKRQSLRLWATKLTWRGGFMFISPYRIQEAELCRDGEASKGNSASHRLGSCLKRWLSLSWDCQGSTEEAKSPAGDWFVQKTLRDFSLVPREAGWVGATHLNCVENTLFHFLWAMPHKCMSLKNPVAQLLYYHSEMVMQSRRKNILNVVCR